MSDETAAGRAGQGKGTVVGRFSYSVDQDGRVRPGYAFDQEANLQAEVVYLRAELARARELAIAGLEAAKVPMEYGGDFPRTWACEHNAALDAKIAEIRGAE